MTCVTGTAIEPVPADGAGIDRLGATGAGWGTHWVWWVSLPILVSNASRAAAQTQPALWDGAWRAVTGRHMPAVCMCVCRWAGDSHTGIAVVQTNEGMRMEEPVGEDLFDPQLKCLLRSSLGGQMACCLIRADQWHSALLALQAPASACLGVWYVCACSYVSYTPVGG